MTEPPQDGFTVPPGMYVAQEPLVSPDFSGWWTRGIAIVKAGWRPIAGVQVGGALVAYALSLPLGLYELSLPNPVINRGVGAPPPTPGEVLGPLLRTFGFALGAAAVTGFVSLLVTLMTVHIVVQIASGRRAQLGPAARAALPRILPLLGWSLLAGLIMVASLCACILPIFYFGAVFTVLGPVVMLERGNAIGRCFRLFHGDLGASLGRIATIVGLGFAVGIVAGVIDGVIGASTGGIDASMGTRVTVLLIGGFIGTILRAALGVLTTPLTVLTYADQRYRLEGTRSADLIRESGLDSESAYPSQP